MERLIIDAITSSADEEKTNKWKKVAPGSGSIADAARADLEAIKLRDPACPSYVHAFLFYKGSQGLQAQRSRIGCGVMVAPSSHALCSLTFPKLLVWIYPAAKFGRGIMIDHATGIVVGETAEVGDDCSLFPRRDAWWNWKAAGDRHPKLEKRVTVGAHASVLGNITIGHDSKIGASASILHDLPPRSVVVGHKGQVLMRKKKTEKPGLLTSKL